MDDCGIIRRRRLQVRTSLLLVLLPQWINAFLNLQSAFQSTIDTPVGLALAFLAKQQIKKSSFHAGATTLWSQGGV